MHEGVAASNAAVVPVSRQIIVSTCIALLFFVEGPGGRGGEEKVKGTAETSEFISTATLLVKDGASHNKQLEMRYDHIQCVSREKKKRKNWNSPGGATVLRLRPKGWEKWIYGDRPEEARRQTEDDVR